MAEDLMRFNKALALSRLGGDEELLREVVQMFLDESPQLLSDLRQAVARSDAEAVQHVAHTLKGSVGAVGGEESMQAALELELQGRRGDLDGAPAALLRLEAAMERLRPSLEKHLASSL